MATMFSKKMLYNMENSSAIRALFIEGQELAKKIGAENVCDYSLGNPTAPVPQEFTDTLIRLINTMDPLKLHGYMNNGGYPEVCQKIADSLNRRFDAGLEGKHIIMTVGAAGALNNVYKALLDIEDDVLVFRPYFGEYRSYISNWHANTVEVDPIVPSFQPDLADFERKLKPTVKIVLLNNPCNPSGAVYSDESLRGIADIMRKKEKEYGHDIYLLSDEPYREIIYDGNTVPWLMDYYKNTFVAYSFSKTLSIPGERIGYLAVSPRIDNCDEMINAVTIGNRTIGYINAPSLMQQAVGECVDLPCNVDFYDRNRRLLYNGLIRRGFDPVKPQGTFYMYVKSPEPNEYNFIAKGKEYGVVMVPGSTFSYGGFVRLAFCVKKEIIEKSMAGFEKLSRDYGLEHRDASWEI